MCQANGTRVIPMLEEMLFVEWCRRIKESLHYQDPAPRTLSGKPPTSRQNALTSSASMRPASPRGYDTTTGGMTIQQTLEAVVDNRTDAENALEALVSSRF